MGVYTCVVNVCPVATAATFQAVAGKVMQAMHHPSNSFLWLLQ